MNNPSKSSPESPAKAQPGEVNAAPEDRIAPVVTRTAEKAASVAAPDVAAMVRRLNEEARAWSGMSCRTEEQFELKELLNEAAALIEKLGQGWIPDDALSFCEDCGMYVVSKPPPPERP